MLVRACGCDWTPGQGNLWRQSAEERKLTQLHRETPRSGREQPGPAHELDTLAYPIQHCLAIEHVYSEMQKRLMQNDGLIFFPTAKNFLREETSKERNRLKRIDSSKRPGRGSSGWGGRPERVSCIVLIGCGGLQVGVRQG